MSIAAAADRQAVQGTKPRTKRRWVSWTIVTFLVGWAVIRLFGLEAGSFLTQLMTLTPYAAVFALVVALLLVRRNRPAALAALAVCLTLAALVLPRASAAAVTQGTPLRVLTINMFGRADADAVVELVKRYRPDVFSALELSPRLADALDAAGLKDLMPHRVLEPAFGATGSGLYGTHPMTRLDNLFTPIGHNMPAAALTLPGGKSVQVIAIHPNPPLGRMEVEWNAALAALPSSAPGTFRVLAGDFNASLDHRALRALMDRGYLDAAEQVGKGLVPTWPNGRRVPPMITIDHILADNRVGVAGVEVLDVPGTDHRGVFAELRL